MKLIHLSDLHIDKKMFGYSLASEQRDVLSQVLAVADEQNVDGVLICGDIYDTAVPNIEAIDILDEFLHALYERSIPVFMISGNHDSAGRLNFGSRLFNRANVHIVSRYEGKVPWFTLEKEGQKIRIHLLPFIKPAMVRQQHGVDVHDWTQAAQIALANTEWLADGANVLLSHQFYKGGRPTESEQLTMGNLDQIDVSVLDGFDYAALGHLHNPQSVGRDSVRYPGTLLKFSAAELDVTKTITVVDIQPNGTIDILEKPVVPQSDFVRIQGTYQRLMSQEFLKKLDLNNYFYIVLDDELEVVNALEKLQTRYPRILKVEYARLQGQMEQLELVDVRSRLKDPQTIVADFFEQQNGMALNESMRQVLEECWEEIHEAD